MIGDGLGKVSRDSGDGRTKEVGGWEEEAEREEGERVCISHSQSSPKHQDEYRPHE